MSLVLVVLLGVLGRPSAVLAQDVGVIDGTVVSAAAGQPIVGAVVLVEGRSESTRTDSRGRFRLSGLPAGPRTLIVQRDGFVDRRERITVPSGSAVSVSVVMDAAPTLAETVTVTASRHEEVASRLPVSIGVVNGDEIRHMRPQHVAEPLNRVPGVHIVAFAGEGTHNSIRQPLCCRPTILMMEDGVPMTSPAFYSTSLLRQVGYAQAGRIEVLKGPGTAVHGSDGMTGVINFLSPDPPASRQIEVTAEAGGAGYQRAMLSAGDRFGRQSILFTGTFNDRDGRRHDPSQRKSGAVRWTALAGDRALFQTAASVNRTDSTGTDDQTPEQFEARSDFNPYPIAFADFTSVRVSTSYEQQTGHTSWRITPFVRYQDVDFVPGWQLSYNPVVWLWSERSAGLRSQIRRDFAAMDMRLSAGIDWDFTRGERQEPRITPTAVGGVWVDWSLDAEPPDYDYAFTYSGIAPYAQVELSPTAKLRITAGARVDTARYNYDNHLSVVQTGVARRPPDAVRSYRQATPKFGVTYALADPLTLVGSYRRGFRVPTEAHLFKQGSSANTLDLQPIQVGAWEGGVRARIGRRVSADVMAYEMRLTDDILAYRAPTGVSQATNNGESRHRGIELALDVALARDLRVDGGYAYARHRFESWQPSADLDLSGFEMDGAPRHQYSARVTYAPRALQGGRLQLEWLGLGDYWLDPQNTVGQDGYNVFHARGSYVIAERYELYARLMNVFDTLYAAQGFLGDATVPRQLNPGEYRTLYAGVTARF